MIGVYVNVPIACFRKGLAREYLETERLPPPATCYGFFLSLIGEEKRRRHLGCRVAPVLLNRPEQSVILRTVWRVKSLPLGAPGNTRPDYQQLLSPVELVLWLDSTDEVLKEDSLEARVARGLERPETINRFGGLCLGESAHLVDEVLPLDRYLRSRRFKRRQQPVVGQAFLRAERGRLTLPVWVDHVGSAGTRYVTGNLISDWPIDRPPERDAMPRIEP